MKGDVGGRIGIEPYNGRKSTVIGGNGGVVDLGIVGGFVSINTSGIQEQCAALLSMYGGAVVFCYNNTHFISGLSETNTPNKLIIYNTNDRWYIKNTFASDLVIFYQTVAGSD